MISEQHHLFTMATQANGGSIFDDYTTVQWIAGIIVGLLTFPIGLLIPIYFYIKTSNGTAKEQGAWEAWAVILVGIIGIVAVELGGETGAKIALALLLVVPILIVLAAVVGSFAVGVSTVAPLTLATAPVAVPA